MVHSGVRTVGYQFIAVTSSQWGPHVELPVHSGVRTAGYQFTAGSVRRVTSSQRVPYGGLPVHGGHR